MQIEVVKATREHALEVAKNLCYETELDLIRGWNIKNVAARVIDTVEGTESNAVIADGVVMCAFGISDNNNVWFLPTANFYRISVRFVRHCRKYLAEWLKTRDEIFCYVYEGNTKMLNWLKWCGFVINDDNSTQYRRCTLCACQPSP